MCEVRLNFFTKTCLTSNYFSRDPHFVILAWVELAGQLCRPQFEAESSDDDGDLQPPPSKKARGDPADRLRGGHKRHRLELFPARGVRKHAQKPCRVCKKNGKRKDTSYYCAHCDVALCGIPCFNKYHTQENYWKLWNKIFLFDLLIACLSECASGNHQYIRKSGKNSL